MRTLFFHAPCTGMVLGSLLTGCSDTRHVVHRETHTEYEYVDLSHESTDATAPASIAPVIYSPPANEMTSVETGHPEHTQFSGGN